MFAPSGPAARRTRFASAIPVHLAFGEGRDVGGLRMDSFLLLGTGLGVLCGLFHAGQIYRTRLADAPGQSGSALIYALWALVLWTVFGSYLLAFWIVGAAGLGLAAVKSRGEVTP